MGCALGLHAGFIQALAIIRLYLAKWYEPQRSGAQIVEGNKVNLFLWLGDAVQDAPDALLISHGLKTENLGICIEISRSSLPVLAAVLRTIAAEPCPPADQILNRQAIGNQEKWDWVLPDRLFYASFASSRLDLAGAHA